MGMGIQLQNDCYYGANGPNEQQNTKSNKQEWDRIYREKNMLPHWNEQINITKLRPSLTSAELI